MSTALRSVGLLDVVLNYACVALGRDALYRCQGWQRAAEAMDGRERPIPVSTASRRTVVRNAG
ncbi:MAG: hypothetical protein HY896_08225 [Deltaproteobacteria bacterium]|nr:hypothetical protein [Deltaproteobacteria bacterium]